jgi:hypothetical protein
MNVARRIIPNTPMDRVRRRAHGVDPHPPGPAGLQGGGDGRKADRNGARIARARENQTRDSAR